MPTATVRTVNPWLLGMAAPDLAALFGLPLSSVVDRLRSHPPTGYIGQKALYKVSEVAFLLVSGKDVADPTMVEAVLRMKVDELPLPLAKGYWDIKLARQKYELAAGDLWETYRVVDLVAEVYKSLRLSLQLMGDVVERSTALDEKQRLVIQDTVDATLNELRERILDGFSERREAAIRALGSEEESSREEELQQSL